MSSTTVDPLSAAHLKRLMLLGTKVSAAELEPYRTGATAARTLRTLLDMVDAMEGKKSQEGQQRPVEDSALPFPTLKAEQDRLCVVRFVGRCLVATDEFHAAPGAATIAGVPVPTPLQSALCGLAAAASSADSAHEEDALAAAQLARAVEFLRASVCQHAYGLAALEALERVVLAYGIAAISNTTSGNTAARRITRAIADVACLGVELSQLPTLTRRQALRLVLFLVDPAAAVQATTGGAPPQEISAAAADGLWDVAVDAALATTTEGAEATRDALIHNEGLAAPLVHRIVGAVANERDPTCVLHLLRTAVGTFNMAHRRYRGLAATVGSDDTRAALEEDDGDAPGSPEDGVTTIAMARALASLFDVASGYFPLQFTPPPRSAITKDDLIDALHCALSRPIVACWGVPFALLKRSAATAVYIKSSCFDVVRRVLDAACEAAAAGEDLEWAVMAVRSALLDVVPAMRSELTDAFRGDREAGTVETAVRSALAALGRATEAVIAPSDLPAALRPLHFAMAPLLSQPTASVGGAADAVKALELPTARAHAAVFSALVSDAPNLAIAIAADALPTFYASCGSEATAALRTATALLLGAILGALERHSRDAAFAARIFGKASGVATEASGACDDAAVTSSCSSRGSVEEKSALLMRTALDAAVGIALRAAAALQRDGDFTELEWRCLLEVIGSGLVCTTRAPLDANASTSLTASLVRLGQLAADVAAAPAAGNATLECFASVAGACANAEVFRTHRLHHNDSDRLYAHVATNPLLTAYLTGCGNSGAVSQATFGARMLQRTAEAALLTVAGKVEPRQQQETRTRGCCAGGASQAVEENRCCGAVTGSCDDAAVAVVNSAAAGVQRALLRFALADLRRQFAAHPAACAAVERGTEPLLRAVVTSAPQVTGPLVAEWLAAAATESSADAVSVTGLVKLLDVLVALCGPSAVTAAATAACEAPATSSGSDMSTTDDANPTKLWTLALAVAAGRPGSIRALSRRVATCVSVPSVSSAATAAASTLVSIVELGIASSAYQCTHGDTTLAMEAPAEVVQFLDALEPNHPLTAPVLAAVVRRAAVYPELSDAVQTRAVAAMLRPLLVAPTSTQATGTGAALAALSQLSALPAPPQAPRQWRQRVIGAVMMSIASAASTMADPAVHGRLLEAAWATIAGVAPAAVGPVARGATIQLLMKHARAASDAADSQSSSSAVDDSVPLLEMTAPTTADAPAAAAAAAGPSACLRLLRWALGGSVESDPSGSADADATAGASGGCCGGAGGATAQDDAKNNLPQLVSALTLGVDPKLFPSFEPAVSAADTTFSGPLVSTDLLARTAATATSMHTRAMAAEALAAIAAVALTPPPLGAATSAAADVAAATAQGRFAGRATAAAQGVADALEPALGDSKRVVRTAAARARHFWLLVLDQASRRKAPSAAGH